MPQAVIFIWNVTPKMWEINAAKTISGQNNQGKSTSKKTSRMKIRYLSSKLQFISFFVTTNNYQIFCKFLGAENCEKESTIESTHAEFSKYLTFLPPVKHNYLRISGCKTCCFFRNIWACAKWMIPNKHCTKNEVFHERFLQ